ncbi:hypothetical protein MPTK1_2g14170 [Marchantia polymorpha subsp. ruderalis]|uniref:Uncharacterized protein n=1 Tax=Marchantia polymorpha TaxID=3197 RepID=A0A2R6X1M5_MARPO|nr:hypothetical protein MARPO_0042s0044 [Marchantia polymorpha]BBN02301.1 hypothetical protein Mp_2g14170 [Marchantia polymorpha subsp. ruderalis]|eukprot:PTQ40000.1 hypothetical protein MARPO_0042s0044 [Marchantia polymorpha]
MPQKVCTDKWNQGLARPHYKIRRARTTNISNISNRRKTPHSKWSQGAQAAERDERDVKVSIRSNGRQRPRATVTIAIRNSDNSKHHHEFPAHSLPQIMRNLKVTSQSLRPRT